MTGAIFALQMEMRTYAYVLVGLWLSCDPAEINSPDAGSQGGLGGQGGGVPSSIGGVSGGGATVVSPPQNVVAPFFVTPISTEVGQIVAVDQGTWLPTGLTTIQIGTGVSLDAFVPHIEASSGTLTAAMVGARLSAVVAVVNGAGTTRVFVDSGVMVKIASPMNAFPPDITPADWSAEEVRDSAPEGRRAILVNASVTVPPGFLLKLYSGLDSIGLPTAGNATLTPGQTFITVGSLAVGSTCHNSLAWLRLSDGVIRRAHGPNLGTMEAQQKSFGIQGLRVTPGANHEAPDVIVNSTGAVRSQIATWVANWDGTVPPGKTVDSDRYVGLDVSTSGYFDLTGLVNARATSMSRRIFVRHVGTFTHDDCSVRHTGTVDLSNSRGIVLTRMRMLGNPAVKMSNSTLTGAHRCIIDGPYDINGPVNPQTQAPSADSNIAVSLGTNIIVTHNLMRHSISAGLYVNASNGATVIGNLNDYNQHDDFKLSGACTDFRFERNWGARRHSATFGGDPHEDFLQHQGFGAGASFARSTLHGNVYLAGHYEPMPTYGGQQAPGFSGWWFGGATPWANQGLFIQAEPAATNVMQMTNLVADQNILVHNNGSLKVSNGVNWGTARATDNTFITYGRRNYALISGQWPTVARNLIFGRGSAGTDGVLINATGGNGSPTDLTGVLPYFQHGPPLQDVTGIIKWPLGMLKDMLPKIGSRAHWSSSANVGASERAREIFDRPYREKKAATVGYGLVPGDVGWPVAKTWNDTYNLDGFVDSKLARSSGYDSNGNLVE